MLAALTPIEARVLGVLIEKERTVPDTYPLTRNALVAGANQKTSREPIMNVTESDVQAALDSLRRMSLVIESSGGRVSRYSHNIERVLGVPRQSSAVLAILMLRGAQTAGELRMNSERLHPFADISSVEGFLRELAERPAGALVPELPRAAGSRENRWVHLLAGAPSRTSTDRQQPRAMQEPAANEDLPLSARVAHLESEVAELKAALAKIAAALESRA